MLMLMALGMLMAMPMVPVMAIQPCRVEMLVAMVMLMTMVMECHSPFDLWEVCTFVCIVACGSLILFTLDRGTGNPNGNANSIGGADGC